MQIITYFRSVKYILIISFILNFTQFGFGQVYLLHDKETIIYTYQNLEDEEYISSSLSFVDSNDVLKVSLNGSDDKIEVIYSFNKESKYGFDGVGNCYKIVIKYFCDICAEKHLKSILEDKQYKWVEISENKYLSKHKYGWLWNSGKTPNMLGSAVLTINRDFNKEKYLELNIVIEVFEKKVWKALINKK